jgi:hypothetical protein
MAGILLFAAAEACQRIADAGCVVERPPDGKAFLVE